MANKPRRQPASLRRAENRIRSAFGNLTRKPIEGEGQIVAEAGQYASGRPSAYLVRNMQSGQTSVVPASGKAGEGVGARVGLLGSSIVAPRWVIDKVLEPVAGAGHTDPNAYYNAPVIADITSNAVVGDDGQTRMTIQVTLLCVPEHYNQRIKTTYEIEIRDIDDGTLPIVARAASPELPRIAGELKTTINSSQSNGINAISYDIGTEVPIFFLTSKIIAQIEDEWIFSDVVDIVSNTEIELTVCERGYSTTSPASHSAGVDVFLRGVTVAAQGLQPNRTYEVHARARAFDGRQSNWTDWEAVITAIDTTPPSWSGAVGLTATPIRNGIDLKWSAADTNASDLAYYELRASPDNSTWTAQRAGNGTGTVWQVTARGALYFQVRAVDTSGNASSWSASVRSATRLWEDEVEKTADLITNGTFPSNTTGWTAVTAGTLSHDSAHGLAGVGCAKIEESGGAVPSNTNFYQDSIGITAGNYYVVEMHVSTDGDIKAVDEFKLQLNLFGGSAVYESALVLGTQMPSIDDNKWLVFRAEGGAPKGATLATVNFSAELNRGVGETSYLYIDDVRMWEMVQTKGLASLASADFTELFLGGVNLDTRIDGAEGDIAALETEVVNARGGEASLDARLDKRDALYMRYTSNAGQNIASGSNTIINYEDVGFESADYVTTGASWKFQPTLAGTYRVTASMQMASSNWSSGDVFQIGLYKNDSAVSLSRVYVPALTSQIPQVQISDLVQLDGSSDYVDIRGGGVWAAGGSKALSTDARMNYICIERV